VQEQVEMNDGKFEPAKLTPLMMTWLGRHLPTKYPKINILPLERTPGENLPSFISTCSTPAEVQVSTSAASELRKGKTDLKLLVKPI